MTTGASPDRRRSLGERISGQYTFYLVRTMAVMLAVFTLMYWLAVIAHASGMCSRAMREVSESQWQTGAYLVGEAGISRLPGDGWRAGVLPQRVDGQLYLVRGSGDYAVVFTLSGYASLFVVLIITLVAVELIRLRVLRQQADRISRRALSPISDIVNAARGLSASNLSARISADGAKDELLELTEVLNGMLDRIESAYNNQKQFVSDASHELRTPIAVIQGYADMLGRWGKSDPEVCDEAITAISSETRAMKDLVEQLLFIARHENSPQRYQMEFFDLKEMADEALKETRLIAGGHHIKAGTMEAAIVRGDRNALKQALRVFLDNALKYTAPDGEITLSCVKENGWARLTVQDNGIGISEEDLKRVFDRFYRAADVRGSEVDGHGLGLAIARMIVLAHGGRIEVQSRPGAGSRFHILLKL
ncbi:MAG: HAMP domain-containing histidine kinase [Clostridia bacterium]|nr:HAMP domain-containing histidine kinase [Clostridia bacterium]